MSDRRAVIRVSTLTLLVVSVIAVTLLDWPFRMMSGFWLSHAMFAGVVSGLLLLALTVFVVEEYLASRERKRWADVAKIAYQDLGREVMLNQRLLESLIGLEDYRNRAAKPVTGDLADVLHSSINATLTGTRDDLDRPSRLKLLYENTQWCDASYKAIQYRVDAGRLSLARWAPVMAGQGYLGERLTLVAKCMDAFEHVQIPLVDRTLHDERLDEVGWRKWVRRWDDYEDFCKSIHQQLIPDAYVYKRRSVKSES